ncbi:MAG: hypothetical protein QXV37_03765, partial [Candidatus Jordarchaeaceae archaeon]
MNKRIAIIIALLFFPLAGLTISVVLSHSSLTCPLTLVSTSDCAAQSIILKDVREYNYSSNTIFDLQWPRPPGWEVSSVNITLSNINTSTHTKVCEDYAEQPFPLFAPGTSIDDSIFFVLCMSFYLTPGQTVYFNKLSALLLNIKANESVYVNIYVLNATYDPIWGILPNETLYSITRVSLNNTGGLLDFKTLNLTSNPNEYLHLNTFSNQTYNNTYFIGISQNVTSITDPSVYWLYARDTYNGDAGSAWWAAFRYNTTTNTSTIFALSNRTIFDNYNDTFDLCLKLYFYPNDPFQGLPRPSDLGLKINGEDVKDINHGIGWWSTSENLSQDTLNFDVSTTWNEPVSFTATICITYYVTPNPFIATLSQAFFTITYYNNYFENQGRLNEYLFLIFLGSVVAAGAGAHMVNKRRTVPRNALRSLEHIIIDHNVSGVLIWAFDFVSMGQDIALVSGFMSAIKSFLEEMKVGGLKRLGTEFGTFIREESELLTATCITSDIGFEEELWIRNRLHKFLSQVEQTYQKQLKDWKGDVSQFREPFLAILASVIDMRRVEELHKQKVAILNRKKKELQVKLNNYGAKIEELKAKYDSGKLSYEEYTEKKIKTEAKYDKVQKEYIYASLFLSKTLPETGVKFTDTEKLEEIQKRFIEIRLEIEELRRKEREGTITPGDWKHKAKLQKELMKLVKQ